MKALRLLLLWVVTLAGLPAAQAQVVTANPVFFTENDQVTLTFDATKGTAGLKDYTGDVYIWTGVISDKSTSDSDWKAVVGTSFSQPIPKEKMTRSATNPNLYTITLTPRTYYDKLPVTDKILKLAMVFRGANGSPEGKDTGGRDILVDVAQNTALSVRITAPATGGATQFVSQNAVVSVRGEASAAATLTLTLNGTQVDQQTNATSLTKDVTITQQGLNVVRLTATNGTTTVSDEIRLFVSPATQTAALPAGAKKDGVTYINNGASAILTLTAPGKTNVYAIGDFNDWQPGVAYQLKKTAATDAENGRWWVQIDGLTPGQEYAYQFLVDGLSIPDPYTEKVLDPNNDRFIPAVTFPNLKAYPTGKTTGLVSVLQSNAPGYTFQTTNFQRPKRTDMVVYELLVRDFLARHDYQTLTDTLKYIQRLGVNVIELMPVNEFEGNESWGYNTSFYFAPDKYYGPKNELKRFIDEAHKRGIAVILDMVLNQSFGQSPMVQLYFENGKPKDNPWFNADATHPFNVGYDFNHESAYTRYFSKRVMEFWLKEYNVDGYRFDLSKGFTQKVTTGVGDWSQYDQSRVDIWKDYADFMKSVDANVIPILEHLGVDSEEKALSDLGLMLWGKMTDAYNEGTMGYNENGKSNTSRAYHATRGFAKPDLVAYMESHDEERLMYKNLAFGNVQGSYSTKDLNTALARMELASAFFFTVPGPKMIWQFGELGFDKSIFECPDGTVPTPYPNDRCKLSNKAPVWNYYQNPNRRRLYDVYRSLIALKVQEPAFEDPATFTQDVAGAVKKLQITDPRLNVTIVGNFDVREATVNPTFQAAGTWYNYLTGEAVTITEAGRTAPITLAPGQYTVYTSRRIAKPAGTVLSSGRPRETAALRLTSEPNPAAAVTTLRYELPISGPVSLTVQNVLGATVRTLSVGRQAKGAQELKLPVQDLANGVYLVRLQAGEQIQTARLVVQNQ
ncbi:alpha-amylase family glycosyl hydrolase [Hymenobacter weizhouensis]|uniref:alpha-amylase family glycosyl hydrolase n=1 Tax=Hymenobacter sp. YIM 151500-1 TaxID=2987689 RepID=UPI002225CEA6|nr:alpha-amylase family glycosyl hydrolase [Hymenobacter sp. YIM 151500-1]UYZ64615.1 alpha-amylase family glycosyl hydrolase [Hymenobacter sp. YIM 151500-1]